MRPATLWLLCFSAISCLRVGLLYSSFTPFDVLEVLRLCPSSAYEVVPILITTRSDIDEISSDVVLDYLYDEGLSAWAGARRNSADYAKMWAQGQTIQ
jgi:hypothetical protein